MQSVDMLLETLRVFLAEVGAFLPRLLLAIVVLIGGWMLAKLARYTVSKALRAVNFGVLTDRAGLDGFLRQGGLQHDSSGLFALLVYWLVILAALIVACNGLGLTYITDLLGRVVWFVPKVLVVLVILAFGSYFARFIGETVRSYGRNIKLQDADLLVRVAQGAIQVFVVLIALDHLEVGGSILHLSFLILLGGVVLALALAFGLGGRAHRPLVVARRAARCAARQPCAQDAGRRPLALNRPAAPERALTRFIPASGGVASPRAGHRPALRAPSFAHAPSSNPNAGRTMNVNGSARSNQVQGCQPQASPVR